MENISINYESLVKTISSLQKQAQRTFFLTACLNADLDLCQACIDAGVDMKIGDEYYGQPFFVDYVENPKARVSVVEWLISNGLDINYHSEGYFSPLKAACANTNCKMVKCLLNKKAKFTSLDGGNYDGEICWIIIQRSSKETERYKIVKMLLEAGAPLDTTDNSTDNPLYKVIKYKLNVEFVKLFLQYGVSANLVVYGISMLNLAVSEGDYNTVKVLLENGADVNQKLINLEYTKKYNGALTPMDIAIANGDESIQALLKEYGGIASTKSEKLDLLFKIKDDKEVIDIIQKLVTE